jgi:hypothetical protein
MNGEEGGGGGMLDSDFAPAPHTIVTEPGDGGKGGEGSQALREWERDGGETCVES